MEFKSGLQLRINAGPGRGLVHPIDCKHLQIGRAQHPGERKEGWLKLNDDAVSRLHAEMRYQPESENFLLVHRSQTNLTYLNGEPIDEATVGVGDTIKMGAVTLELQEADRRWGGVPEKEVTPLEQRNDLNELKERPPARHTFAVRVPREPARAPEPVERKVTVGPTRTYHLTTSDGSTTFELNGNRIRLGAPFAPTEDEEELKKRSKFDHNIEPGWEGLTPLNVLISWDELAQTHTLALGEPEGLSVSVVRDEHGFSWRGRPTIQSKARLQHKDVVQIGDKVFTYLTEEEAAKPGQKKIKL